MKKLVIVRGGGDIASGTIWILRKAGYRVLVLEIAAPSAIRRTVAFSEAVYTGCSEIEGMRCCLARTDEEAQQLLDAEGLAMMVDPDCSVLKRMGEDGWKPFRLVALVDAILAKKNLGTSRDMAPFVLALGPGFCAPEDCNAVIETMRGHQLGRIIEKGAALKNTGVPGLIAGHAEDRVLHAEYEGILYNCAAIGDLVEADQKIAEIVTSDGVHHPVQAGLKGLLRGLIRDGFPVTKGFKIADIDPRESEYSNCFTISDKARCIGGAVLMAIVGNTEEL